MDALDIYEQLFAGISGEGGLGDSDDPTLRTAMRSLGTLRAENSYLAEQNRIRGTQLQLMQREVQQDLDAIRAQRKAEQEIQAASAQEMQRIENSLFQDFEGQDKTVLQQNVGNEFKLLAAERNLQARELAAGNTFGDVSESERKRLDRDVSVAKQTLINAQKGFTPEGMQAFKQNRDYYNELFENSGTTAGSFLGDIAGATLSTAGNLVDQLGTVVLGGAGAAAGGLSGLLGGDARRGAELGSQVGQALPQLVGQAGRAAGDFLGTDTQSELVQNLRTGQATDNFNARSEEGTNFFDNLVQTAPEVFDGLTAGGLLQVGADLAGAVASGGPILRGAGAAAGAIGGAGTRNAIANAGSRLGQAAARGGTPAVVAAGANQFADASQDSDPLARLGQAATQLAGSAAIGTATGAAAGVLPTLESTAAGIVSRAPTTRSTIPRPLTEAPTRTGRTVDRLTAPIVPAANQAARGAVGEGLQETAEDAVGQVVSNIGTGEDFQFNTGQSAVAGLQGAVIGSGIAGGAGAAGRIGEAREARSNTRAGLVDPEGPASSIVPGSAGRTTVGIDGVVGPPRPAPAATTTPAAPAATPAPRAARPVAETVVDPDTGVSKLVVGDFELEETTPPAGAISREPRWVAREPAAEPGGVGRIVAEATDRTALESHLADRIEGVDAFDTTGSVFTTIAPEPSPTAVLELREGFAGVTLSGDRARDLETIRTPLEDGAAVIKRGRGRSQRDQSVERLINDGVLTLSDADGNSIPTRWTREDDGTLTAESSIAKGKTYVKLNEGVSLEAGPVGADTSSTFDTDVDDAIGRGDLDGVLGDAGGSTAGTADSTAVPSSATLTAQRQIDQAGPTGTTIQNRSTRAAARALAQDPTSPVQVRREVLPGTRNTGDGRGIEGQNTEVFFNPEIDTVDNTPPVNPVPITGEEVRSINPNGSTNEAFNVVRNEVIAEFTEQGDKDILADLGEIEFILSSTPDQVVSNPSTSDPRPVASPVEFEGAIQRSGSDVSPSQSAATAREFTENLREGNPPFYEKVTAISELINDTVREYVPDLPDVEFLFSPNSDSLGTAFTLENTITINPFRIANIESENTIPNNIDSVLSQFGRDDVQQARILETSLHEVGHIVNNWILRDAAVRNPQLMKNVLRDYVKYRKNFNLNNPRTRREPPAITTQNTSDPNSIDSQNFSQYAMDFTEYMADGFANAEIRRAASPETQSLMQRVGDAIKSMYQNFIGKNLVPRNKPLEQLLTERREYVRNSNIARNDALPPDSVGYKLRNTKVRGRDGNPLRLYRGSNTALAQQHRIGIFGSNIPAVARAYTRSRSSKADSASVPLGSDPQESSGVTEYFADLRNPLILDMSGKTYDQFDLNQIRKEPSPTGRYVDQLLQSANAPADTEIRLNQLREVFEGSGYDGAIIYNDNFQPRQDGTDQEIALGQRGATRGAATNVVVFNTDSLRDVNGDPFPSQEPQRVDVSEVKKNFGERTSSLATISDATAAIGNNASESSVTGLERRRLRSTLPTEQVLTFSGVGNLSETLKQAYEQAAGESLGGNLETLNVNNDLYVNSNLVRSDTQLQGAVARNVLSNPPMRSKIAPLTVPLNKIAEAMGGVEGMQAASGGRQASPAYQTAITGVGRDARIARNQMVIDAITDTHYTDMTPVMVDSAIAAGTQVKKTIMRKFPELAEWADMALSPMSALELTRANAPVGVGEFNSIRAIAADPVDYSAYRYENKMIDRYNIGRMAERYKARKKLFPELHSLVTGSRTPLVEALKADKRLDDKYKRELETLGIGSLLAKRLNLGRDNILENDNNLYNKMARRLGHDRRVLKVRFRKFKRQIGEAGLDLRGQKKNIKDAALALSDVYAPELAAYVEGRLKDANVDDALDVFQRQDLAQNATNFEYTDDATLVGLRDGLRLAIDNVGNTFGGGFTTTQISSTVNSYMQMMNTAERLRHKIYTDPQFAADAAQAAGVDLTLHPTPASLINAMFKMDGANIVQAGTPALNKFLNTAFTETGFTLDDARTGLAQMRAQHSDAEMNAIDKAALAAGQLLQFARDKQDASGLIYQKGDPAAPMAYEFPLIDRSSLDDINQTSTSGDLLAERNLEEGVASPLAAIDSYLISAMYQANLNPMRDAILFNMLATKTVDGYAEATDNAFNGDVRVVSENDPLYVEAFRKARDPNDNSVMLHHLPKAKPDDVQLAVIMENLEIDNRGENILYDVVSKKDENKLINDIRNSGNVAVQSASRAAGNMARLTTSFNPRYWMLGMWKDMAQNGLIVASELGATGGKNYVNHATNIMSNIQNVNKYARLAVTPTAAARKELGDLIKSDPMLKDLHEFREAGGMPDFLRMLQDPSVRDRDGVISQFVPRNLEQKPEGILRGIESISRTGDLVARFATYRSFRDGGSSTQDAASRSYEVAPFARTGESAWADVMAMGFSFFRSGASGNITTIDNILASKYGPQTLALSSAVAAGMFAMGMMLSGDDDNGENRFLKEGLSSSGIKFFLPGAEEGVQLPVPYGGPGVIAYATIQSLFAVMGAQSAGETFSNIADQVTKNAVPLSNGIPLVDESGETQFVKKFTDLFTPSAMKPAVQAFVTNTNDFGNQIDPYSDYSNDYTRAMRSPESLVGSLTEGFVRALSNRAGIDLSVRRVEHMFRNYVPGVHAMANGMWDIANFATGDTYDRSAKDVLFFASPFIASPSNATQRDFYRLTNESRELVGSVRRKSENLGMPIGQVLAEAGIDPVRYQKAVRVNQYAGQVRQARGEINSIYSKGFPRDERLESASPLTDRVQETMRRMVEEIEGEI